MSLLFRKQEKKLRELQNLAKDSYSYLTWVEEELIAYEKPSVRPFLRSEFEFQRTMNMIADSWADRGVNMPYRPPKTETTILLARILAKNATAKRGAK